MERIARASRAVRLFAVAMFVVAGLTGAVSLYASLFRVEDDAVRVVTAYAVFGAVVVMALMLHIARLAKLYEEGRLFTAANVGHIKWIGRLTLLTCVGPKLVPDDAGQGMAVGIDVLPTVLVVGLLLIFMSWVMDEARALKAEADLVI